LRFASTHTGNFLCEIFQRGDRYLRSLFTTGALAVIRYAKIHGTRHRPWLTALLARRPTKVALAYTLARPWQGDLSLATPKQKRSSLITREPPSIASSGHKL
jgi:hypothetical protein